MDDVFFRQSDTGRGTAYHFGMSEQQVTVHAAPALMGHPRLREAVGPLLNGFQHIGQGLAAGAADQTPTGLAKAATAAVRSFVADPFNGVRAVTVSERSNLADRQRRMNELRFDERQTPQLRSEQRGYLRALPLAQRIEALHGNHELLAAFIEGGHALSGMPLDIYKGLLRRHAVENYANQFSHDDDFKTKPSVADPIGGVFDQQAARQHAEKRVAEFEAERDTLDEAPRLLSSIVEFTALVTDQPRSAAFTLLTTAA